MYTKTNQRQRYTRNTKVRYPVASYSESAPPIPQCHTLDRLITVLVHNVLAITTNCTIDLMNTVTAVMAEMFSNQSTFQESGALKWGGVSPQTPSLRKLMIHACTGVCPMILGYFQSIMNPEMQPPQSMQQSALR